MCNLAAQKEKKITPNMEKHDFVTIANLTREKILYMIEMAQEFERHPNRELLKGKVVATLFFEPSTRTRLSFINQNLSPINELFPRKNCCRIVSLLVCGFNKSNKLFI